MLYSSLKYHKYRISQGNVQTPSIKVYKTILINTTPKLRHSNSHKSFNKFHIYYSNTFDKNSTDIEKTNNILSSNSNHSVKDISIQKGFSNLFDNDKIYSSIISKIEHLKNLNKYNKIKLYYFLIKIDKFINNFFQKNDSDNTKDSVGNINISNKDNKDKENKDSEINILKKRIEKLKQKITEIENKFIVEKLSYLFCIGENQKQIAELERIIKVQTLDKMPKSELNKVICFPQYSKFDVNDDINPKSVPMFLTAINKRTQTPKSLKRNESQISKDNSIFNKLFQTEIKKIRRNFSSSFDNSNKKEDINKNNAVNYDEKGENQKVFDKEKEIKKVIELGQKYFNENIHSSSNIFKNSKNYFLAHPKLNYIKDINSRNNITRFKFGNQMNSLPKQLNSLKAIFKSQKNAFSNAFPSSLNETLLNIEKLKTSKNFRSINYKFENIHKIKIQSND